jgi:hypothetical protein
VLETWVDQVDQVDQVDWVDRVDHQQIAFFKEWAVHPKLLKE